MTPKLPLQIKHLEKNGLINLAQTKPQLEYIFRHTLLQDATYIPTFPL
ncbi:MAG TPA: hypothetical protein VLL52_03900 [Anaerolineae bacterium]|nr:hypothetical protein [Anaerolineae bacterium]